MSEPQRLDPQERETERVLGKLNPPAPSRTSAALVLIEVERRRHRFQLWAWRSAAAILAVAMVLQFTLRSHPSTPQSPQSIYPIATVNIPVNAPEAAPIMLPMAGSDYISTRNRLVALGVMPVPAPVATPASPPMASPSSITDFNSRPPRQSLIEILFTNNETVQS